MFPKLIDQESIRRWHTVWSPSQANLPVDSWAFRYPILGRRRRMLPEAANMVAGRLAHDAISRMLRGETVESASSWARREMMSYGPRGFDDGKDQRQKMQNVEDMPLVIVEAWKAIEPIIAKSNYIESESKMLAELPGVVLPVIGYNDLRFALPDGPKVIELKTKWRTQDARTKSGFKAPSLPKQVQTEHRGQASFYAHATGCQPIFVYARPTSSVVFDEKNDATLQRELLVENIEQMRLTFMTRQRLLSMARDAYDLAAMIEPDWTHYTWDIGPAFLDEAKTLWRTAIEGQNAGRE